MHFSSVLLPEPLRPTTPKNSPLFTVIETPLSASSFSLAERRSGCSARSFSVWTCSVGSVKLFETSSITTAGRGETAPLGAGSIRQSYG